MLLRNRLANPPPLFVGRRSEIAWLRRELRASPVALVAGPGGIGKTALVLHTLHRHFAANVGRAIAVAAWPRCTVDELRMEVARALAEARGIAGVDWARLLADPEALVAATIDLAEQGALWLVMNDLHHLSAADMTALLSPAVRYARTSRWIATTRERPAGELTEHTLWLDGLDDDDLARLAQRVAPSAGAALVRRAVAGAAGSPWRLRQELAEGTPSLGGWPPDAVELLSALAALRAPVPLELLAPLPAGEIVQGLERAGLLERTDSGVRVHDAAREALPPCRRRAALADALAAREDPALQMEALGLLVEDGRADAAAGLLDRAGAAWISAGHASRLWRLIGGTTSRSLAVWRLRCAVELGDAAALAAMVDGAPEGLDRVRALLLLGRFADAAAAAQPLAASPGRLLAGDGFEASLLAARALRNLHGPRAAVEVLAPLTGGTAEQRVRRDVLLARALLAAGDREGCVRFAHELPERLDTVPHAARAGAAYHVAVVLYELGRLHDAARVLAGARSLGDGGSPLLFVGRQAMHLQAGLAVDRGALDECAGIVSCLTPLTRRATVAGAALAVCDVARRLAAGELDGLDGLLAELRAEVELHGWRDMIPTVDLLSTRLGALRGDAAPAPSAASPRGSNLELMAALCRQQARARHGISDGGAVPAVEHAELRVVARRIEALVALAEHDVERALQHAAASIWEGEQHGYRILEAESRAVQCEILLCAGRRAEAARAAEPLAALARALPSPLFAAEARFFALAAQEQADHAALEELTVGEYSAARRARALLDGDGGRAPTRLDAIDLAILAVLREAGWRPPRVLGGDIRPAGGDGRAAWGIDETRRLVWLPGGRRLDFTRRPLLLRVLAALAEAGGAADKEALVQGVWRERTYHPLRHDNRLQAAVRALREAIEDDPSRPARLLTTAEGYALAGPFRWIAGTTQEIDLSRDQ